MLDGIGPRREVQVEGLMSNRWDKEMKLNSVYKKAYDLALKIFRLSKKFPDEERFALTSQIRRSARSVCLNLREAWRRPVGDLAGATRRRGQNDALKHTLSAS